MRAAGMPDVFIVLNGPQDGTEYPIVTPSIEIGQSKSCAVHLQLDQNVQEVHATATATGNGYSIRATSSAAVVVEGKNATRIKSRLIRPGEIMRVGYTDLVLECSPDGMASRSKGIAAQSDFSALFKGFGKTGVGIVEALGRLALLIPKFAWKHKFLTVIAIFIAMAFAPGFDDLVGKVIAKAKSLIADKLR